MALNVSRNLHLPALCLGFDILFVSLVWLSVRISADPSLPIPSKQIDTEEFLDTCNSYNLYTTNRKQVNATVLAFVTPWNKHGYEVSETFAAKFDILSPVWFQVLARKKAYTVLGIPNINKVWLERVRSANSAIKITPRFIFDEWSSADFSETFSVSPNANACISNIVHVLKNYKFDGAVLELWSQFSGTTEQNLIDFIVRASQALREAQMLTILVIPPSFYRNDIPGRFGKKQFEKLTHHVDYFSLMTYDFSPPSRQHDERAQILTGFNFYGLHHVPDRQFGDHILGHQFVDVVNASRAKFLWDEKAAEHYLKFRDTEGHDHYVYYPTLMSVARRIALIESLGTGAAIWEIGQGLDSFYSYL
ncbi:Chitinase domain-containing protein 1 [Paragonimus heterotremus]|uniref:Chitinase domain-containing protein 1 n=1 Tax=Paragonimus heterotremus TaxID=100268 RepID=A0A8J4TAX4_9TREM|nr:Chitinase domain-containing protein 1 [Paragonimus heterotremus]